jgi:hypothetical protein
MRSDMNELIETEVAHNLETFKLSSITVSDES